MNIAVVGSLNMDYTYELNHLPQQGETIISNRRFIDRGGKGQNQAVAMGRLNSDVMMVGAVGNDPEGDVIKSALKADKVNTDCIFTKSSDTGTAIIYLDRNSKNSIVVNPASNFLLTIHDIKTIESKLKSIKYCVMQLEIQLDVVYYCLEYCHNNGITTILNPAPANPNFDRGYYKYVDFIIPNETELEILTGGSLEKNDFSNASKLCKELFDYGCKNVILTLGDKGSRLFNSEFDTLFSACEVKAVDTTAAGDSYVGAFTCALAEGKTTVQAIKFATKAAALSVTKYGAIGSLPYRHEIV